MHIGFIQLAFLLLKVQLVASVCNQTITINRAQLSNYGQHLPVNQRNLQCYSDSIGYLRFVTDLIHAHLVNHFDFVLTVHVDQFEFATNSGIWIGARDEYLPLILPPNSANYARCNEKAMENGNSCYFEAAKNTDVDVIMIFEQNSTITYNFIVHYNEVEKTQKDGTVPITPTVPNTATVSPSVPTTATASPSVPTIPIIATVSLTTPTMEATTAKPSTASTKNTTSSIATTAQHPSGTSASKFVLVLLLLIIFVSIVLICLARYLRKKNGVNQNFVARMETLPDGPVVDLGISSGTVLPSFSHSQKRIPLPDGPRVFQNII